MRDAAGVASKQHHFPVVLTAQFGVAPRGRSRKESRKRIVWMARRGSSDVVEVTAESVGWSNQHRRLYDLPGLPTPGATIDGVWQTAERGLPVLVAALTRYQANHGLKLNLFYLALVPLVAQLMVRHPDFQARYRDRVQFCAGTHNHPPTPINDDTVNLARYVDYLCLCGLLASRRWWVLTSPFPLITSELGYCGLRVNHNEQRFDGYLVPLHRNLAVYVCTGIPNPVQGRAVRLDHRTLTEAQAQDGNEGMAGWSPAGIFGDERPIRRAAALWVKQGGPSSLSRGVPDALLHDGEGLGVDYAEHWLRALHDAQFIVDGSPHRPFDMCADCQTNMALFRSLFDGHAQRHADESGIDASRRPLP